MFVPLDEARQAGLSAFEVRFVQNSPGREKNEYRPDLRYG
jgi:hypothetical protein